MSENITHPLIVKSKGAHEVARRVPRLEIVAVVLILALSLGLRLVNLLNRQIQGTLELDINGEGTTFNIIYANPTKIREVPQ